MVDGIDLRELFRRSAVFVDKIFKGGRSLPTYQSKNGQFELVVNLKSTESLGINILPTLLARADEVIE